MDKFRKKSRKLCCSHNDKHLEEGGKMRESGRNGVISVNTSILPLLFSNCFDVRFDKLRRSNRWTIIWAGKYIQGSREFIFVFKFIIRSNLSTHWIVGILIFFVRKCAYFSSTKTKNKTLYYVTVKITLCNRTQILIFLGLNLTWLNSTSFFLLR